MSESKYNPIIDGLEEIGESWGWFMFLGILLILAGVMCIAFDVTTTLATVLVFGWMLLVSGVFALLHAMRISSWSGFFLFLLSALFRGFTGYLLIRYPTAGAEGLTLVLASFFIVGGLFRAIVNTALKFAYWGWPVISGIISVALGIALLSQLPMTSVWFIGFAVGIDFIADGAGVMSFAAAMRHFFTGAGTYLHGKNVGCNL